MDALDVLIVEDHEAMRTLLTRALTAAGAVHVRAAEDADAALALLRERPATLILADQNMPGKSGLDFIAAVRAEARFGRPHIVLISGGAHDEAGRAAGADLVLQKPVSPRELIAALNALIS